MNRDSVTYRLATSGEKDVIGTLAKIAESGEAGAKRTAKAWERDMRTVEAVLERANRNAERLKVLGGSATARRIAESTGLAQSELGNTKSAEASMAAFVKAQDELARGRQRLLAQADPLYAAQQRYNTTMAEAVRLDRQGALAAGDLSRIHLNAKAELDQYSRVMGGATKNANLQRMGFQQLTYQVADVGASYASNINPMIIFAQQGTQVVQSLALMGAGADASTSKFARFSQFLVGPWGLAVMGGVSVLGILATSYLQSADAAEKAESKTFDFSRGLDVLTLSAKDSVAAMEQLEGRIRGMIELQGDFLRSDAAIAYRSVEQLEQRIANARGELAALEKRHSAIPLFNQLSGREMQRMSELRKQLADDRAALDKAIRAAAAADIALGQRAVTDAADPNEAQIRNLRGQLGELESRRLRSAELERSDPLAAATQGWFLSQEAYKAEVARINDLIEKAEELKSAATRGGGESSRAASIGDMTALLKELFPGVRITSTLRPGDKGSDHSVGRAIDFVPAGGMSQYSTAEIEEILRGAGVDIRRNAKGTQQLFGPGRHATKPGDHDDHFHLAWDGKAPDAYKMREQAEKALQEQIERNTASVRALVEAGDPYAAIAFRLQDELAEIDRLAGDGPAKGGLGSEEADIRRQQARDRATLARGELFNRQNPEFLDAIEEADRRYAEQQRAVRGILDDQERINAELAIEEQYLGKSSAERDRQLALLDFKLRLEEQGVDLASEQAQALIRGNEAIYERAEALRRSQDAMAEQQRIGESIIDTLFDPSNWDDWGDMGMRVLQMLIQEMMVLAAVNPLKNALFNTALPTLGGVLGGGGGKAGQADFLEGVWDGMFGNAIGTEYSDGGWRRVGEFGEELVRLPRGSQVMNAPRTRAMQGGSGRPVLQFDLRGAVMTEDILRQMQQMADAAAAEGAQRGAHDGAQAVMQAHHDSYGAIWQT